MTNYIISLIRNPIKGELIRGLITSVAISLIPILSETFLRTKGVSPSAIYMYHDMMWSNLLGFILDAVFASAIGSCILSGPAGIKRCTGIDIPTRGGGGVIFNALNQLGSIGLIKYAVTVLIDIMISVPLFVNIISSYPSIGSLEQKLVKALLNVATFLIYVNKLRFSWAYKPVGTVDPGVDMAVIVFAISMCTIFLASNNNAVGSTGSDVMNISTKITLVCVTILFLVTNVIGEEVIGYFKNFTISPAMVYIRGTCILALITSGLIYGIINSMKHPPRKIKQSRVQWGISLAIAVLGITLLVAITIILRT